MQGGAQVDRGCTKCSIATLDILMDNKLITLHTYQVR